MATDVLRGAAARARAAFPEVDLPEREYFARLARALPDGATAEALARVHVEDLYLAGACACGDARALRIFEQRCLGKANAALHAMRLAEATIAEALQRTRDTLFVPRAGKKPKIDQYSGRGDLAGFVRSIAVRAALDLVEPTRETLVDPEAMPAGVASVDPQLAVMKEQYGRHFKAAMDAALGALKPELRRLLSTYYLDGVGVEAIAGRDRVGIATVSRRLAKARQALAEATRKRLMGELRVGPRDLESILRLIQTRLEFSRERLQDTRSTSPRTREPRKKKRPAKPSRGLPRG